MSIIARVTNIHIYPQANIKSEAYGYAIADATKAIELNPKLVKVSCVFGPVQLPPLTYNAPRLISAALLPTPPSSNPKMPCRTSRTVSDSTRITRMPNSNSPSAKRLCAS